MTKIFSDGRWAVVLRVQRELSRNGIETNTDTNGISGQYSVSVLNEDAAASREIINAMEIYS
jgi:hypothetical protein